jgi:copper resistance protein D
MDSWVAATAFIKFFILLGTATVLAAWLFIQLRGQWTGALLQWNRWCAGLLLLASVLSVPIQAGALAEAGWAGMVDIMMLSIVWHSPWGDSTVLRLAGSVLAITAVWWAYPRSWLLGLAGISLALAFSLSGHLADQPLWLRTLLVAHVAVGLAWLGSLLPFYLVVCEPPSPTRVAVLSRFGHVASVPLLLLLGVGAVLIWEVLDSPMELFNSLYGQLLLCKLILTLVLLSLGAWHRFFAIPRWSTSRSNSIVVALRTTLAIETSVGLLLLAVLAIMTTVAGPAALG